MFSNSSERHERISNLVVVPGTRVNYDRLKYVLERMIEYVQILRKNMCKSLVEEVAGFGMIFSKQGTNPDYRR